MAFFAYFNSSFTVSVWQFRCSEAGTGPLYCRYRAVVLTVQGLCTDSTTALYRNENGVQAPKSALRSIACGAFFVYLHTDILILKRILFICRTLITLT